MNEDHNFTRRSFMKSLGITAAASSVLKVPAWSAPAVSTGNAGRPALLGGTPVRTKGWPDWPQEGPADEEIMKKALLEKRWCYLRQGAHFCRDYEKELSKDYGGAHVMLTNAGTNALHTCMYALDVGPGDEVLITGDSFIASMQAVLNLFALPIFIDVDSTTGLMDPALIEQAITPKTRAIMPIHLFGASCDMDAIMPIATRHNLKVIEDACQSPYVEYDGRKLGTIGDCGAISFNVWKTLGCGEGGAIVTTNDELARACDAFRNNGRTSGDSSRFMGMNYRPTEFQAALMLTQTERYRQQAPIRRQNVAYLEKGLKKIPGLKPLRVYPKTKYHNHYNYQMLYDADAMGGLPVDRFTSAMRAEGIPFGSNPGADIMSQHKSLDRLLESNHFKKCYTAEQLQRCQASRECPHALYVTRNMVQFSQAVLLGSQADMDDILEAVRKIQRNTASLIKT